MTTNRLGTPLSHPTDIPTAIPIGQPTGTDSVPRSDQASHGRTDGRTDEELPHPGSESSRNASPAGGLEEFTIRSRPGDVVRLDTGEVCGLMAGDIVNPWVLLNDLDDDGNGVFYEPEYVEAHAPALLVRDAQPLDSEPPQGPVEGRGVAEIRADLATCEQLAIVPWPAAARRLLADVPSLLAEVEAAHRFERAVADGLSSTIYDEVRAERERAHAKHGATSMESTPADDPTGRRYRILVEEVGEVGEEWNDAEHEQRPVDLGNVRKELIQVAAMAAAWADACGGERP